MRRVSRFNNVGHTIPKYSTFIVACAPRRNFAAKQFRCCLHRSY
jgi:hypothetical protein